ncbi:hypothetical protein [Streptomyces chrestomyceticus]|uniref:Uncharacterized protein n=1 Tax=Streptomyces chrestomyceticus TaxID=68185 RepID=A0ABU7X642_9ACTN
MQLGVPRGDGRAQGLLGLAGRHGLAALGGRVGVLGDLALQAGQRLGIAPIEADLDVEQLLAHLRQPFGDGGDVVRRGLVSVDVAELPGELAGADRLPRPHPGGVRRTAGLALRHAPGRPLSGDLGDVRRDLLLGAASPQPLQAARVLLRLQVIAQAPLPVIRFLGCVGRPGELLGCLLGLRLRLVQKGLR